MTTVAVPICYSCVHLTEVTGPTWICAAYPDGIPDGIIESQVDHRLPYTGDHGIHFDQDPLRPPPDLTVFEGPP